MLAKQDPSGLNIGSDGRENQLRILGRKLYKNPPDVERYRLVGHDLRQAAIAGYGVFRSRGEPGADPQPGANTTFNGTKLSLYDAAASSDNTAIPGTVISIGEFGIQISTGDGAVNIGRVRESGSGKVTSSEWAESVGLAVGDLLGT